MLQIKSSVLKTSRREKRGNSAWAIRPGDIPPDRLVKEFPGLEAIENNCVFRYLVMRSRRDGVFRLLIPLWVGLELFGMFAFNSNFSEGVRICAGAVGVLGFALFALGMNRQSGFLYRVPEDVATGLASTPISPREVLMGIVASEAGRGHRQRQILCFAMLTAGCLAFLLIGGWMNTARGMLSMAIAYATGQLLVWCLAMVPMAESVVLSLSIQAGLARSVGDMIRVQGRRSFGPGFWLKLLGMLPVIACSMIYMWIEEGSLAEILVPPIGGLFMGGISIWIAGQFKRALGPAENDIKAILDAAAERHGRKAA